MKKLILALVLLCVFLLTCCASVERFVFHNFIDSKLPPENGSAIWTSQNPEISFSINDDGASVYDKEICKYNGDITVNGEQKKVQIVIDIFDKSFEIYEISNTSNHKLLHAYFVSSDDKSFAISVEVDNVFNHDYAEIVFQKQ